MERRPNITFLFPLRWLTEDKEYFAENIKRQIIKFVGPDGLPELKKKLSYDVTLVYIYYKPINPPVKKSDIQLALKPLMPHARLMELDYGYTQTKSKTALPLIDFQIFF